MIADSAILSLSLVIMLVVLILLIVAYAFLHCIVIALPHSVYHVSFVLNLALQRLRLLFFLLYLPPSRLDLGLDLPVFFVQVLKLPSKFGILRDNILEGLRFLMGEAGNKGDVIFSEGDALLEKLGLRLGCLEGNG